IRIGSLHSPGSCTPQLRMLMLYPPGDDLEKPDHRVVSDADVPGVAGNGREAADARLLLGFGYLGGVIGARTEHGGWAVALRRAREGLEGARREAGSTFAARQ